MKKRITLPLNDKIVNDLQCGDQLLLTGEIYTARDAAHKRLFNTLKEGGKIPIDLNGITIYYMGPSPTPPGEVIGSAGPTTSHRMDKYAPLLMERGVKGMIGKGLRTEPVIESIKNNNAVYMAAIGGAGALLQQCIKENETIAYDDLGTEAIRRLWVEDFPVTVAIDHEGNSLYKKDSYIKYQNHYT